jgi:hypothetical protein
MLIDGDLQPIYPDKTTKVDRVWLTLGGVTYLGIIAGVIYLLTT